MTRRQKDSVRRLTADERQWLERISRSHSDPASQVLRAKLLLADRRCQLYRRSALGRTPLE